MYLLPCLPGNLPTAEYTDWGSGRNKRSTITSTITSHIKSGWPAGTCRSGGLFYLISLLKDIPSDTMNSKEELLLFITKDDFKTQRIFAENNFLHKNI